MGITLDYYPPIPTPKEQWRGRWAVCGISLSLFLAACAAPAIYMQRDNGDVYATFGYKILPVGWLGILVGQFAWFANFALLGSWICTLCQWRIPATLFAAIALLIAVDTLDLYVHPPFAGVRGVNHEHLNHLGWGFYFWISSMLALLIGSLDYKISRKDAPIQTTF
jgi:hypothetical protein